MATNESLEVDKYDNWRFSSPAMFDDFWFSDHTTRIFNVFGYKVGLDRFGVANLRI